MLRYGSLINISPSDTDQRRTDRGMTESKTSRHRSLRRHNPISMLVYDITLCLCCQNYNESYIQCNM